MAKISTEQKKKERGIHVYTRKLAVFALIMLFIPLEVIGVAEAGWAANVIVVDFLSCDRFGAPLDYFPIRTTVYFNVGLENSAFEPKNVSITVSVLDCTSVPLGSDQLNTSIPLNTTAHYIMSVFIRKWARVGLATAHAAVFVEGKLADGETTQFYIDPEDLTPPVVSILSPENVTYGSDCVPLIFTANERPFWMGYNLNNQGNVTVESNSTLADLANGHYSLVIYVNDTSGNVGFAQVHFTILLVHDIAVTDIQYSPPRVYVGQSVSISISVQNEGTTYETFNVSLYANTTTIATFRVTNLSPADNTALPFTWNTTTFSKGNYTIKSTAHPVLEETDTADNTCLDGPVNVMGRPDISVTSVVSSKTVVGQGYSLQIHATIKNGGDRAETFNMSAYADSKLIQTKAATLSSGGTTIITFFFSTTSLAKGNYTVITVAWPVPNETDTADNILADGWIFITIPGDVNADRHVDIFDMVLIANLYETSQTGDLRYQPNCDINGDGQIDIFDFVAAAGNYGENW